MTTRYGVNTSFCNWTSRLPLFANPGQRARLFEIFDERGHPTGEPAPLGPDGWPLQDGRWHGVRLFGDMDGQMPELSAMSSGARLVCKAGESAFLSWKHGGVDSGPRIKPAIAGWHIPSLEALGYFKPKVLRTLDWGWQARREKRPNWGAPRVYPDDPLQGEEMAVELQCDAANKLNCHLWWNAPPRFELPVENYEHQLSFYLAKIKEHAKKPPILEYGNELWNGGFPVHGWLEDLTAYSKGFWHLHAADEIAILKRVADRVFGEPGILGQKPYWLFVGGHIAVPDTLDKILSALSDLGVTPDIAGPAFYARPRREDVERWEKTGYVPEQDELKESVLECLVEQERKSLAELLQDHSYVCELRDVPHFGVYEWGLSLIANGKPWKKAAIEFHQSEAAAEIVREQRRIMEAAGVDLACLYSACTDQDPKDARVDTFGFLAGTLDKVEPLPKARAARGD